MKRNIITIDEEKCTGCGACVPNCPEGALQIINGKARLVGELLCDGLGACIGRCPEGALTVEEKEVEPYDERKVMDNVVKGGTDVITAHLTHLKEHGENAYLNEAIAYLNEKEIPVPVFDEVPKMACGCPGTMAQDLSHNKKSAASGETEAPSQLSQWPIQLKLINPQAPYFKDADLVIAADCVPFSFARFHEKFLQGKRLIVFCPKLDNAHEAYIEKLSAVFSHNAIRSLSIVYMEVPCCFGTMQLVNEALKKAGKDISINEYTITLRGEIKNT